MGSPCSTGCYLFVVLLCISSCRLKFCRQPFQKLDKTRFEKGLPHIACRCPACTCTNGEDRREVEDDRWKKLEQDVEELLENAKYTAEKCFG